MLTPRQFRIVVNGFVAKTALELAEDAGAPLKDVERVLAAARKRDGSVGPYLEESKTTFYNLCVSQAVWYERAPACLRWLFARPEKPLRVRVEEWMNAHA